MSDKMIDCVWAIGFATVAGRASHRAGARLGHSATINYRFWRWLAPRLPTRRLRDRAWERKWALWFALYGNHERIWR